MSLSKKIFIISSSLLAAVLLFWGIYILVFQKKSGQPAIVKDVIAPITQTTESKQGSQIELVTDEAVLAPTLSVDGKSIKYYSKSTGKVYEIDILSDAKKIISDTILIGLTNILWSPDTTKVLSEFSTASGYPSFSLYDYSQKKGVTLNNSASVVAWQNDNKILYQYSDAKKQTGELDIADADGSNWEKITDLAAKNIRIAPIPKTGLVSFWNSPDAFVETTLQSIPAFGGETKILVSGKFGADFLWSPDGNMLLESNVDTKGGPKLQLGTTNSSGGEYKNLDIPSFISKCAWSIDNKNIYYALPGSIPDGVVLPNDYNDNKFTTSDTFWKVNIITGEKTRLVALEKITAAYDATSLFLNSDESFLFFINKIDRKLYKIAL
ncbi:MAG: hypothetical protein COX30_04505 [Candidatus Moranbacteria bacterium CG23_combo_of_CG06-09_8_20_14_all_39_10]|nr:MAG: hypothetical protein COX30_04505 [Candidatus Moranbacteria bacterium CG23_combo_of_CG06-09_8_20_14_all_39_10]